MRSNQLHLFCLTILAFCLTHSWLMANPIADNVFGKVAEIQGEPKVIRRLKPIDLKKGDELLHKDRVRTKVNDQLEILTTYGDVIKISPRTSVVLTPPKDNTKKEIMLQLLGGIIRSKVVPLQENESFQVRSPVSVAGVRGTDFLQSAEGLTTVIEGKVEVTPLDKDGNMTDNSVLLLSSQQLKIDPQQDNLTPTRVSRIQMAVTQKQHEIKTPLSPPEIDKESKTPQDSAQKSTEKQKDGSDAEKQEKKQEEKNSGRQQNTPEAKTKDQSKKSPTANQPNTPTTGSQPNSTSPTTSTFSNTPWTESLPLNISTSLDANQIEQNSESNDTLKDIAPQIQEELKEEIIESTQRNQEDTIQDIQKESERQLFQLRFELQHR